MLVTTVATAAMAASCVLAAPVKEGRQASAPKCTTPLVRKAWHTLSTAEKKAYIDAELCLMKRPAELGLRGAKTRFDEFQSVHVFQAEIAHFVGQFLPFHRLYVWAHEQALRNECGYQGAQPYWAEELDAGAFNKSILFDPVTGFGGNGVGRAQCIADGPFAGYNTSLGPGYGLNNHCITRNINNAASWGAYQTVIDGCLAMGTYATLWSCIEGLPHGAGHGGVGAEMVNPVSSPGDPIFYLHHTWLDRIWAKWQDLNQTVRFSEVSGNNRPAFSFTALPPGFGGGQPFQPPPGGGPPSGGFPPGGFDMGAMNLTRPSDVPQPKVIGDPGNQTTLAHLLQMHGMVEDKTIAEVMDTRTQLCYEYD